MRASVSPTAGAVTSARLAARLADVEVARLVTSPLQRCRETAELLLPGATAEVVDDLGECHYGAWTGRPIAELVKEPLWRTVQDDPASARFPASDRYAAESLTEMAERTWPPSAGSTTRSPPSAGPTPCGWP